MHHLARHLVACFLTRGDLWLGWEPGRDIFDKYLLDADWALNTANWQWLSASAFFNQYWKVYSPVTFFQKTDKNGDYIRKYVPVLKHFPAEYIYDPHKAPLPVQKRAKCIIGVDYPLPMVEHSVASKRNIERMKIAFANEREGKSGVEYNQEKEEEKVDKKGKGGKKWNSGSLDAFLTKR